MEGVRRGAKRFGGVFRERLLEVRLLRGMAQTKLAKILGWQSSSISHYEAGNRRPSLENLGDLADALGVSSDYLLGRSTFLAVGVGPADPLTGAIAELSMADKEVVLMLVAVMVERRKAGRKRA